MSTRLMRIGMCAVLALSIAGVSTCAAAGGAKKAQAVCPVMGGKINKKVYTDYQGQRVYFCCPGCISTFKKDADKYFEKIEASGAVLESVQKKCPVMGGKINKKIYTDYKGRRVYLCCPMCITKFKDDPQKYLKKLGGE